MVREAIVDPKVIYAALQRVNDEASFIQELLAVTLNWPIPGESVLSFEQISYDWTKDARKAPQVEKKLADAKVAEVNLTGPDQHWGVFVLKFKSPDVFNAERGMTGVLREVLRWLVPNRRKDSSLKSWNRDHLLFICTHDYSQFRFAYFKAPVEEKTQARLAAFGWHAGSSAVRTVCEFNLSHLAWPNDPASKAAWVEQWARAFDVERVTKRFYEEYAEEDERLRKIVATLMGESKIDAEPAKMFVQTLLNRLMFLRFIERKGWLTPPGADRPSNDYLRDLFAKGDYRGKSFYSGRLCKLFFEGLAAEGKQQSEAIGRVPFLNGGLFESKAGLDDKVNDLPNEAFEPLLGERGLFYRFNFTVQESTPLDVEVAVDPEMLGKVFEELVTGRHESGSYYTPRPIVSFMCREALKGYLADAADLPQATVTAFVDHHQTDAIDIAAAGRLVFALDHLKAVDPACGSGAYLLGLLHEMVDLYSLLYSDKLKKSDRSLHDLKLRIISHSIYGVDIDRFATNVAMLRLWLSLSVDSNEPLPLPNLDFKIETGDSLTGPCKTFNETFAEATLYELARKMIRLKEQHLQEHTDKKHAIKTEIDNTRAAIRRETERSTGRENVIDWFAFFPEVFAGSQPSATFDGRFPQMNNVAGAQRSFTDAKPGGFDIVLANPPYVRHSLIKPYKPILRKQFPNIYAGSADLCCYFYGRAVQLLRPKGVLAFISSNKWMKANYGKNLRTFLLHQTNPVVVIDFGHSPIFDDADTFPCVPILTRRALPDDQDLTTSDGEAFVACEIPWGDYDSEIALGQYVRDHQTRIPKSLLNSDRWSLEDPRIHNLMHRISDAGQPLRDLCRGNLYIGPVTGLDKAFHIDAETRTRLISEDPQSEELIRPMLRGRDLDRWRPKSAEAFIIVSQPGVDIRRYPALVRHLTRFRSALAGRACQREWYELQGGITSDFAAAMTLPKIVYQEIQFHSRFAFDSTGNYINHKVFLIPSDDLALLGVLSSPLMWWYLTRFLPHMKDEALCTAGSLMAKLPISIGVPRVAAGIRSLAKRLIALTDERFRWESAFTADVCLAAGVAEPDDRMVTWLPLPLTTFARRLAPLTSDRRAPNAVAAVVSKLYTRARSERAAMLSRQLELEQSLASLVEDAYGLSAEERALLRKTRPVRDPLDVLESKLRELGVEPNAIHSGHQSSHA